MDFSTRLPRKLYRADQIRKLDQIAIEEFGISGFNLMHTAATVAFNTLLEKWPQTRYVQIFAGSGNNAGDGYIVAGLAHDQGIGVEVIQLSDPQKLQGDAKKAWQWAQQRQVEMAGFSNFNPQRQTEHANTVIVDALLGTGLDRAVAGDYKSAIEYINSTSSPVVAIDIPSGLSADTGQSFGTTVIADLTITFIAMKQGMLTNEGRDFVGEIIYHDLDVPKEVFQADSAPLPSATRIDINYISHNLRPRARSSHKGTHGHVLIMGGDYSYGGAVIMAAEAAQRSGAGLVSVITRSTHRSAMLARRPEIMVVGTEDESPQLDSVLSKASVIVIGPGLGRSMWGRELLQQALSTQMANKTPLVIDADALHLLAGKNHQGQTSAGSNIKRDNWILTPHPGEAAALLNCSIAEIQADRFLAVRNLNKTWGGVCLLKGSGSLICADQQQSLFLSSEGNAGMASGGMGDVLSGLVASLVAQGLSLEQSLCSAVCIHGEAADLSMEANGQRGMVATDLFPYIRQLVNPVF
ncbi:MAG: bifunctional ADP-dependent NAD(P)H-hydrate dehydratase/NAD(P)H-hydrate epimerase [SAR86 cluster bacterium]|uniref:Bifunctional NAD(P)H-hydrate repair enzyme n=1 Tax=SAR86 cluster bacterium TaxID=2030880 RepID=A0A2A5AYE6_9GAMM|nr:MAG: bifunctional ADP-dependent NAD(P)H-hydrate dehydratase/NAD(P)H-hydrate epimerase [SAR86 cluster bacterium]